MKEKDFWEQVGISAPLAAQLTLADRHHPNFRFGEIYNWRGKPPLRNHQEGLSFCYLFE